MAKVTEHSSVLYTVEDGGSRMQIALLPSAVVVYGEEGKQYFKNPLNLPARQLKRIFPTAQAARAAAMLDTIARVDMRRLMQSMEKAHNDKKITPAEMRALQDVLGRCDCTPEKMKEKVVAAGLGRLVHLLVIEDHNPALDATVRALMSLVGGLK